MSVKGFMTAKRSIILMTIMNGGACWSVYDKRVNKSVVITALTAD